MTFDDIMLGVSVLRNRKLANVFYRLKLIEACGTGILRINECYADCEAKPLFEATDNAFKITLPNTNFSGEAEEKKPVTQSKAVSKKIGRQPSFSWRKTGDNCSQGCGGSPAGISGYGDSHFARNGG